MVERRDGTGNGPHLLRRLSRSAVLRRLRDHAADGAAVTASELVAATGLSRPAVGRALVDLDERGLITELASARPLGAGRPARRFRFAADRGLVAGLEVGPQQVQVLIADLAGQVLTEHRVATTPAAPTVLTAAADATRRAVRDLGRQPGDLWAVGVGSPGVVDPDAGAVRLAPSIPGWAGLPVSRVLGERLGCPVLIDNDVNLATLAERLSGAGRDHRNFAFVYWDERVGSGLVFDGQQYRGSHFAAGEVGFLQAAPGATSSTLGAFEDRVGLPGLLRTLDSAPAELAAVLRSVPEDDRLATLFGCAEPAGAAKLSAPEPVVVQAESLCRKLIADFCDGVAALVLVADPGMLVLGGRVAQAGPPVLRRVREQLRERVLTDPEIVGSELGERAVCLGAMHRALETVDARLEQAISS
ncbi:ROK family transcriptional regulator [Nakamurella aerolata]|uniref:ROK family protein n=1 Tax=Nakamurella aerolata TaxID=1656892 RepID=A0A849ABA2_9ACTN|nr:ROK family protein [Nakamurella aerolata]NNG36866.1 ROK family protein [Nakamurella aerolata]